MIAPRARLVLQSWATRACTLQLPHPPFSSTAYCVVASTATPSFPGPLSRTVVRDARANRSRLPSPPACLPVLDRRVSPGPACRGFRTSGLSFPPALISILGLAGACHVSPYTAHRHECRALLLGVPCVPGFIGLCGWVGCKELRRRCQNRTGVDLKAGRELSPPAAKRSRGVLTRSRRPREDHRSGGVWLTRFLEKPITCVKFSISISRKGGLI